MKWAGVRRSHRHADDVKQDAKSNEQRQDQQRQQQTGVLQNGLGAQAQQPRQGHGHDKGRQRPAVVVMFLLAGFRIGRFFQKNASVIIQIC